MLPFIPKYVPFLCPSFHTAQLTITHCFPCSCPPPWLQCSCGQLCALGGWAVQFGSPGSGHVHLPAAALPRYLLNPSAQPNPPSLRSPVIRASSVVASGGGGESPWSVVGATVAPTHTALVPPPGPQPPHLTLCHRLGGNSRPGPGMSAGRTQFRRGALWHHGPAHRTAGAEGLCTAH